MFALLCCWLFWATPAQAHPWAIDNVVHWTVDLACQDGYIGVAYENRSGILSPGASDPALATRTMQAHLLNADFLDNYPTDADQQANLAEFGLFITDISEPIDFEQLAEGQLGVPNALVIEEQTTPLFVDFSQSDLVTWYDVGVLVWGQTVDVDRLIAIEITDFPSRMMVLRVADCTLPEVGETWSASVADTGKFGNLDSAEPALSANGTRITFSSNATNLDPAVTDDNDEADIFVHTLTTDHTQLVSYRGVREAVGATSEPDISYNGERVVFTTPSIVTTFDICTDTDTDGVEDVHDWQWDEQPSRRTLSVYQEPESFCNVLDGVAFRPNISQNDIVFSTETPLATPSNNTIIDNNSASDILLLTSEIGATTYEDSETQTVSTRPFLTVTGNGASNNAVLTARSQWVAFETTATNLTTDNNGAVSDILLRDTTSFARTLISVASDGTQADGGSYRPAISADANHIAFESAATNLHADIPLGTTQIYVRDRQAGCTTLLSQSQGGVVGDGDATNATISADGRLIAFTSTASNLVPNDTNNHADIFLVNRDADGDGIFYTDETTCSADTWSIRRISQGNDGSEGNGDSTQPDLAASGAWVAFTSAATNLTTEIDTNESLDVFTVFLGYPNNTPPPLVTTVSTMQSAPQPFFTLVIGGFLSLLMLTVTFFCCMTRWVVDSRNMTF